MRFLALASAAIAVCTTPSVLAQDHRHHHGHHGHEMHQPDPTKQEDAPGQTSSGHDHHSHGIGPAGSTFDLRFIDGMVEHHTGALRMSEYVFNIGAPGVGA